MAQIPRRRTEPPPAPPPSYPPPLRTEEDNYPPPAVQDRGIIASGGGRLPAEPGVEGESYPPPEPVKTIADEQRERSAYIESIGVEAYKAENDSRTGEEGQPQVEGARYPESYDPPQSRR
jgi:hypothetical protein